MKKTIGLIMVLIVMLLALTGCGQVNYEVEIFKDGSGEITYIYGVSKDSATDLVKEIVGTLQEQAEDNGYAVDLYEDEKITGFKANKHIADLNKDFSLEEAFGKEYVKDSDNNKIKIENNFWNTKYSQSAELDLTNLNNTAIEMTYKIKLPTKVKTSNANKINENCKELTWNLKPGGINKIEFVAEEINKLPIAIILIAVVIIAVAVVIGINLKKKQVTKK